MHFKSSRPESYTVSWGHPGLHESLSPKEGAGANARPVVQIFRNEL